MIIKYSHSKVSKLSFDMVQATELQLGNYGLHKRMNEWMIGLQPKLFNLKPLPNLKPDKLAQAQLGCDVLGSG